MEVWNELKTKLTVITTINNCLTELDQLTKQVENKKMKISQITGHAKFLGELSYEDQIKVGELNEEIEKLYQKIIPLKEKIATLNPFWGKREVESLQLEILTLRKDLLLIPKIDNLADIERLDELKLGYQQQIEVANEKCERAEKKLDKVRDLVVGGNIKKLIDLINKGEI